MTVKQLFLKALNQERRRFLVVGFSTVFIDWLSYSFLVFLVGAHVSVSKAIGFVTGAIFSYFVNGQFTFGLRRLHKSHFFRFCFLYISTLSVNVFINQIVLWALDGLS